MQDSVTVHMAAAPDEVWALISDVTRTGEFSPETFEAEWLGGATGPALGARFRGHVNRNNSGVKYWTACTVTACEPGRAFGFSVGAGNRVVNNWLYELVPTASGTDVTESYRLEQSPVLAVYWKLFGKGRGRGNRKGMTTTLNRIKAVVEA